MKLAIVLTLSLSTLAGWANDCEDLLTLEASQHTTWRKGDHPPTLAEWSRLSREDKAKKLSDWELDYVEAEYDQINDAKLRKAVDEMAEKVLDEVDQDNIYNNIYDIEYIFAVGEPYPAHITLFKIDDTLVGLGLGMYQDGAAMASETAPPKVNYASHKEAKAALGQDYELSDVNWQVYSTFEFKGWKWEELDIDTFDEGFRWSGW